MIHSTTETSIYEDFYGWRVVARDAIKIFNVIFHALEDVSSNLPILETYVTIFDSSQVELLRGLLTSLYTNIIGFDLKAVSYSR